MNQLTTTTFSIVHLVPQTNPSPTNKKANEHLVMHNYQSWLTELADAYSSSDTKGARTSDNDINVPFSTFFSFQYQVWVNLPPSCLPNI